MMKVEKKEFGMTEIAEKAQEVFDEMYSIEDIKKGNIVLMHREAWNIAHKQLKEEFKPDRSSFKDIRNVSDLDEFEHIVYDLLKLKSDRGETIEKSRILRICSRLDRVRIHIVNTFEDYEYISPKVAILEVSKVNSELRQRFFKERDNAEQVLGYRPDQKDM